MGGLFASRRSRLVALLLVATAAVSVLVVVSAGASLSYYVTPEEYQEQSTGDDTRWRVAGRVVGESIVEVDGRPISFTMLGYEGTTVEVAYDGGYPSLFGPNALVIVEGVSGPGGGIDASSVIIKHENEFVTDPEDTRAFVPASE
ncbi:MAG TPA: cytochrome c maturation protein CcmE [Dehalococcoidia bacterium]|jgi:cytochrome c-type biogenesis protein CcmE|nr:cytochrome c maturation protein CcmE [Dehalococcoidia bacterium]